MINEWCRLKLKEYSTSVNTKEQKWEVKVDDTFVVLSIRYCKDHSEWEIRYVRNYNVRVITTYEAEDVKYNAIMEKAFARFLIAIKDLEVLNSL